MDNTNLFFLIYNLHGQHHLLDLVAIYSTNYGLYFSSFLLFAAALKGGPKEKKSLLLASAALLLTYFANNFIHLFIHEPRPFLTYNFQPLIPPPNSFSFPSGHSEVMTILALSLIFTYSRWMWLFVPMAFWIFFTRMYVGVHYPLDILGGILTGLVAVLICWNIKNYIWQKFFAV